MINSIILINEEIEKIITLFHNELGHIGINRLLFEIERRGKYINNLKIEIENIIKKCTVCVINKLNHFIKPANKQIISRFPLDRVQIDITYFLNKINIKELENKYLLTLIDHFSKFSQSYVLNNKTSEEVIKNLKFLKKDIGVPKILHSDNGGEFTSNLYKLFCWDDNIKIVYGASYHPQSQGTMEAFNKTIIQKLEYIYLQSPDNFVVNIALSKAIKIYNTTIHSIIKIEPEKAFKFKKKKTNNRKCIKMWKFKI